MEVWKSLDGIIEYGSEYEVSNRGEIKDVIRDLIRKPVKDKDGYLGINITRKGKTKGYKIHRLVALAFISNLDELPEVNHKDGVRHNNTASNLEWTTRKGNMTHAKERGSMKGNLSSDTKKWQGDNNASAKLSEEDVYQIVEDWNTGLFTFTSLGKKHNMSRKAISAIINRKSWTHLNLDIKFVRTRGTGIYERE